jgi:hypothetical protein
VFSVPYIVTAADGSTVTYMVTITAASTLNSVGEIEAWIDEQITLGYGASTTNPIVLPPLDINLAVPSPDGWTGLLNAIAGTSKFVELDLSGCEITGTVFNPDNTISTGKQYVTALTLPGAAAGIAAAGSYTNSTFRYFSSLREIDGEQVTDIGQYAFSGRTSLTSVTFPAATDIGDSAFFGCTGLTSVTFPAATDIGWRAFQYCDSLTSVTLSASLSTVAGNPFAGCTALTNISVDAGNPNFSADGGMLMNKDGTTLIAWPSASGPVTLTGITIIGIGAFQYCYSLESVTLSTAADIGFGAFSNCIGLTWVNFPAAADIGDYAFQYTSTGNLTIILGNTPPSLGTGIFDGVNSPKTVTVEVPTGAAVNYDSAWQNSFTGGNTYISLTITEL